MPTVAVASVDATAGTPIAPGTRGGPWGVRDLEVQIDGRIVLREVSLEVSAAEIVAVVGGDGSGKTTLLRALVGAIAASAGFVARPPERALGYVSAALGGYGDLTVDENLDFAGRAYGVPTALRRRRTEELLERTNLREARVRLGDQLSGGMRRKLALAMAVIHQPALLVLDEPSTGVDPVGRAELWRLLTGLAAGGTAIVLSTTYLDEAERVARVLVLADGRTLLEGSPDELLRSMSGVIGAAEQRPEQGRAWRNGSGWQTWLPGGVLSAGLEPVRPTLEDAVIVAQLAHAPADDAALGRDPSAESAGDTVSRGRPHVPTTQLEGSSITRRFGDVMAVRGVEIRVAAGEVVGLVGANGSGKTTLIRVLLGLLAPTSGSVALFGSVPTRERRARVGYVPQLGGLYDDLTVMENLQFEHAAYGGTGGPSLPADLADLADRLCGGLSLGLRRRVAFAMALSHEPQLLVLDEPTSGVDSLARTALWDTIRSAAERGMGVLVTTHHMSEAGQCDRLLVLSAGSVVANGTQREIIGDTAVVEVRADPWEPCFNALDGAGLLVSLAGRAVRVIDSDRLGVEKVLAERGISAEVSVQPATLDETFVMLARRQTAS